MAFFGFIWQILKDYFGLYSVYQLENDYMLVITRGGNAYVVSGKNDYLGKVLLIDEDNHIVYFKYMMEDGYTRTLHSKKVRK